MGVIIKIKNLRETLTHSEKKIADYILNNLEKIKDFNTYEIALNCKTSQASVVRFAKKIGYKGFPDFKLSLSQDLGNKKAQFHYNIINEVIKANDTFEIIGKKITNENVRAINNTFEVCDFKVLNKAVNLLSAADKIMIVGVGFSGIVAKDFYYKLMEIGKNAIVELDTHIQLSCLTTMNQNDILFVISHSGKTMEMYNIAKLAKEKGIKVISMTNIASNPIRDISDIALGTVEIDNNFRETAFSPRISQLTIIDMLYVKMMIENKKFQDYIYNAIDLVQGHKLK